MRFVRSGHEDVSHRNPRRSRRVAGDSRPRPDCRELLQKGIYTQDTAGDLDGAIAIYRRIVNSGNSPRDVAAQAQYRLAQSLIEKGDLANGATEFSNLARNYSDYARLISTLAAEASKSVNPLPAGGRGGRGGADSAATDTERFEQIRAALDRLKAAAAAQVTTEQARAELERRMTDLAFQTAAAARQPALAFDSESPVSVKGKVFKMEFLNGQNSFAVDPGDSTGRRYTFVVTSSPGIGPVLEQIRKADMLTVTGFLAKDGRILSDGTIAAVASTITTADGEKIYDRGVVKK